MEPEERITEEQSRSHDHLRRFSEAHPKFLEDHAVETLAHRLITDAQLDDLHRDGLMDRAKFPKAATIHDAHLDARAAGHPGVRSIATGERGLRYPVAAD
jgi:hypothetical protein